MRKEVQKKKENTLSLLFAKKIKNKQKIYIYDNKSTTRLLGAYLYTFGVWYSEICLIGRHQLLIVRHSCCNTLQV